MSYANAVDQTIHLPRIKGSNPYRYWQAICENAEWVEAPNQRRQGHSGVKRAHIDGQTVYIKTQSNHCHHSVRYPLGRPTVLREADAIQACQRLGIMTPRILFCGTQNQGSNKYALLVTKDLTGYISLEQLLSESWQALEMDIRSQILEHIAYNFSQLHRAKWQHSAMYPKHVFVKITQPDSQPAAKPVIHIAFIDLEKSRKRLLASQASEHDLRQFRKHNQTFNASEWQQFTQTYQRYFTA